MHIVIFILICFVAMVLLVRNRYESSLRFAVRCSCYPSKTTSSASYKLTVKNDQFYSVSFWKVCTRVTERVLDSRERPFHCNKLTRNERY